MQYSDFFIRYVLLLVGVLILLRGIYFRITPNRDSVFSFFLFANGVFLITYFLHNIDLSMGFAFGLFAVFAMLRYRTEPIAIRDMTYLFVVIGLALMCSISKLSYLELAALTALVCILAGAGETRILAPRVLERKIIYDNIELIKPSHADELRQDLTKRTGLDIVKVEIGRVDYLTDSAQLLIFYSQKMP